MISELAVIFVVPIVGVMFWYSGYIVVRTIVEALRDIVDEIL